MHLRCQQLESALRVRVEPFDARRRMSFWQKVNYLCDASPTVPMWLGRSLVSLALAAVALCHTQAIRAHATLAMAGMAWWGLVVVTGRAGLLWNSAQVDPEYQVLWILPVSAHGVFRYLRRQVILGFSWLFLEFLLFYGILAAGAPHPFLTTATAVLAAGAQTACAITLLFLLVALKIKPDWVLLPLFCVALLFLGFAGTPNESRFAEALCQWTPLGWLSTCYLHGSGNASGWWRLVPTLLIYASLPYSLPAVRRLHLAGAFRTPQKGREWFASRPKASAAPPRQDLAGQAAPIGRKDLLRPLAWNECGVVERMVSRLLKPHEQVIAQMLLPDRPRWSNRLLGLLVYVLLYLAANTQLQYASLEDLVLAILGARRGAALPLVACLTSLVCFAFILFQGAFLLGWFAWPEAGLSSRPGFRPVRSFQLFPVNYWEAAKVIAKVNSLLLLLLFPLTLVLSFTPLCQLLLRSSERAHTLLPKALCLVWACSLGLPSLKLTPSFQEGLRHWRPLLKKSLLLVTLYLLGMGLLIAHTPLLDCVLTISLSLLSVGWFFYSGRQYCK